MTITPHYSLSQSPTHVIVDVRVPYVRVSPESIQVVITDGSTLHVASPPYLLLLNFAHAFDPNADEECATFLPAIQHGTIQLRLKKQVPEHWDDLDLLGKLVPPTKNRTWLREIVREEDGTAASRTTSMNDDTDQQQLQSNGYGFFRMFHGLFVDLNQDGALAKELLECPWDEHDHTNTIRTRRRNQRIVLERDKFDADRYWQDMDVQDDYCYVTARTMRPHWRQQEEDTGIEQLLDALSLSQSSVEPSFFTSDESLQLALIPYPILPNTYSQEQNKALMLGLVDILFAYAYDHLLTDACSTVESAWTVSMLSASLSWLDDWADDLFVTSVVHSSLRRSLIYPYLRNLPLSQFVWNQVVEILRHGVRCVVRCLLQTRAILNCSDFYYFGNKLFLDPYLGWVQKMNAKELQELLETTAHDIHQIVTGPYDQLRDALNLGLEEIENHEFEALIREGLPEQDDSSGSDSDDDDNNNSGASTSSESSHDGSHVSPENHLNGPTDAPKRTNISSALLDCNLGMSALVVTGTHDDIEDRENKPCSR